MKQIAKISSFKFASQCVKTLLFETHTIQPPLKIWDILFFSLHDFMMDDVLLERLRGEGWTFPPSVLQCLSARGKEFVASEFERSVRYYQKRLENLGFTDMGVVLDTECGMGQWSLALSYLNSSVIGIDINMSRLLVARTLAESHVRSNLVFRFGMVESLPFEAKSFDGVFAYSLIPFVFNIPKALREIHRVLKANGLFYMNTNSYGWYFKLLRQNVFQKKDWRTALKILLIFWRTLFCKKGRIVTTQRWTRKQIRRAGFDIIDMNLEGKININGRRGQKVKPIYPERFHGLPTVFEVLAQKKMI